MSMNSITGGCACGAGRYCVKGPIGFHILIASSLDDPSLFSPTEVINRDEAAPWHKKAASFILDDKAG